jgi:periplasmic copper chaperone A
LKRLLRRTCLLLAAATLLSAAPARAQVTVADAWANATLPQQHDGGAFMTIRASGAARLIGASTPAARSAQLHLATLDGGVMRMRPVAQLALPAGCVVSLAPGGYHLMLLGLARPLVAGEKFPVTLAIEDAAHARHDVVVQVDVLAIGAHGNSARRGAGASGPPAPDCS